MLMLQWLRVRSWMLEIQYVCVGSKAVAWERTIRATNHKPIRHFVHDLGYYAHVNVGEIVGAELDAGRERAATLRIMSGYVFSDRKELFDMLCTPAKTDDALKPAGFSLAGSGILVLERRGGYDNDDANRAEGGRRQELERLIEQANLLRVRPDVELVNLHAPLVGRVMLPAKGERFQHFPAVQPYALCRTGEPTVASVRVLRRRKAHRNEEPVIP